ncbi:MAG: serine protease [Rhodospirillales bacterium]|nr:serine protease [Rhodospirillales bacterium]
MRRTGWIFAAGLLAVSATGAWADPVQLHQNGDLAYPADYFGRVDLPLPQAFTHLKRLIGDTANFEPIESFSPRNRYRIMAGPIGRLDILKEKDGKQGVGLCTGWVISAEYIMTNHHCIPGKSGKVLKAALLMNYMKEGETDSTERFPVDIQPVETSRDLDYSIVRVQGNPGAKYGVIPMQARDADPDEELFIIQHPAGKPKRLTRRNCRADDKTERPEELRHFCDTLGGSSGSPIFSDNDMALVGLHFAGIEKEINFAKRMTVIIEQSPILKQLSGGGAAPEAAPTASAQPATQPPKVEFQQPAAGAPAAPAAPAPSGGWQPIN